MPKIQASAISIQITHVFGFVVFILSAYASYVLKTIKKDHDKLNDEFSEFRKDSCCKITELYDSRHEMSKEIVQVKQRLDDCQKFHGANK